MALWDETTRSKRIYAVKPSSASQVQIRNATASDASGIASILREAFVEYRPLYTREGYSITTPGPGEIRVRMEHGPLWVAVYQGRMVGTASAVAKPEGLYIRGMAVVPAARSLGVGRLLLQHVESFAAASGCHRLFLSTTPFLDRAIRLYKGFGFRRTNDGPHDLFGTPLFTLEKMLPSTADKDDPGQRRSRAENAPTEAYRARLGGPAWP